METQFAEGTLAVQVIVLVQPPVSLEDAPLRETLKAVLAAPVGRRVLALGGPGEDWLPAGFDLMAQPDAYATAPLPMLLIRADTLEISADIIEDAARSLISVEADAAFGPASDGGCWLLGLRPPDRSLVAGVPAPGEGAGRLLLERLATAGLRVALAPRLEIAGAPAPRF